MTINQYLDLLCEKYTFEDIQADNPLKELFYKLKHYKIDMGGKQQIEPAGKLKESLTKYNLITNEKS